MARKTKAEKLNAALSNPQSELSVFIQETLEKLDEKPTKAEFIAWLDKSAGK